MKKLIIIFVIAALLLVGCQAPSVKTPPVETNIIEVETGDTPVTPEEPANNEQPTEPAEESEEPTEPDASPVPTIPGGETIAVDHDADFTPILYSSGGRYLVLGGSYYGQWLKTDRFEGKLDGEMVENRESLDEHGIRKDLEFALLKKGTALNFYNLDGCVGDGMCDGTEFIIDGFQNVYYEAKINVGSGVDTPTIGLPNTSWNPFPFPGQYEGMEGLNHFIDIDRDGVMDTIKVEETGQGDGYKTYTITLLRGDKETMITEFFMDDTYLVDYNLFFLDLNGDDTFEIIISQEGHNFGVSIFTLTETGSKEVMYCSIGD